MKLTTCNICGKEIHVSKYASLLNPHYCKDCKDKKKLICKTCGKEFIGTKNTKFCCNECRHIYNIVPSLIKYFGFDKNKLGNQNVYDEVERVKNMLYDEYWTNHHSSTEICNKYHYPNIGNLVAKIFHYLNIPVKKINEVIKENYLYNRIKSPHNTRFKSRWYTTWDGKEVYLRSSYETQYANELDSQKIEYEVEALRIKYFDSQLNEYRCAIPDFFLPKENMIVEIKSEYTLDEQNMRDKKKAYLENGYNFKLICDFKEKEI